MDEAIHATLAASIPVFCLTLAGWVTGAHITNSDQGAGGKGGQARWFASLRNLDTAVPPLKRSPHPPA